VMGFDDTHFGVASQTSISTIRQPSTELGQAAVRSLIRLIGGQPITEHTLMATELIVRDSTARIKEDK